MSNQNLVDEIKRDMPAIIGEGGKKLVERAEKLGNHLSDKLSTSQIRNIFSEVKQMQKFDENKLNLIRPKLAYTAGRHRKKDREIGGIGDLQNVLDDAIQKVDDDVKFQHFKEFFEAIVAYHKYYGGKD